MNSEAKILPATDSQNIVVAADSGIGNRVFFMASAIRIFNIKDFNLYWPDKGWVSAKFFDLFSFKWDYKISEFSYPVLERNLIPAENKPLCYTEGWRLYISENDGLNKNFAELYRNTPHGFSIDLEYNRIPESVKNIYRPFFERLKPSDSVQKRILDAKSFIDSNTVAVQVRNNPDWSLHKRNLDLNVYFKIMDKYPKNTKFFLCCMNDSILNEFIKRYTNRVVYLPNKDYNSMADSVADLYLMSYCTQMIVSYESTFPCLAWWLGGAKAKVTIAGLPSVFKRKYKKLIRTLFR